MKRERGTRERLSRGGTAAVMDRASKLQEPTTAAPEPGAARWELAALAALMVLAAGIRLYRLTALSLWEDEGFTAYVASEPVPAILRWCGIDLAPPLYYLLLHFWIALFPGEFGLRLFSAACGVLAIPLIYLCGRSAHSTRAGLYAALLLTPNACHVHFSQEARYYTLYFAAGLLAVYFTLELAKRPTRGRWIGWVVATAVMLLTHSTAALYVLALTGLLWTQRPRLRDGIWRGWLIAHAAVVAIVLPVTVALARQSPGLAGHFFPPVPTLQSLIETTLQMFTVPFVTAGGAPFPVDLDPRLLILPFLGLAVWAVVTCLDWGARPVSGLLVFGLGAWGLFFTVSVVARSLYILRVLIPVMGALLVVAGIVLASQERAGRKAAAGATLALLVLSGALSLHLYYRYTRKQEIRDAVTTILAHAGSGDAAALVQHRYRWAVAYYMRGQTLPLIPANLSEFADPNASSGGLTPAQAAAELRKASSLWVIELDDPGSHPINQQTEAWLQTFLRPVEEKSFYAVRVVRYAPK